MPSIMDGVDRLTQLAGHNRLELLMFRLGDKQRYGINVFKVQEVIHCPPLTQLPNSHPVVCGIANIRGNTISVMDLAMAIGKGSIDHKTDGFIVVAEYNGVVQGFLVSGVDRIVNMNWEAIRPPPKGMGSSCYLTAVTEYENAFVQIIDVEKVLSEVTGIATDIGDRDIESSLEDELSHKIVLAADDSAVARKQIQRPLEQLGVQYVMAKNGREALEILKGWAKNDRQKLKDLLLIISDVEMPEMDGYTLTTEIRKDADLKDIYIMLHTSLSGIFNHAMIEKVGADRFLPKYNPEELANAIMERLEQVHEAEKNAA
ncbi:MAG: chemotaxis protein CheV [Gammaproteobacteria bacterium]